MHNGTPLVRTILILSHYFEPYSLVGSTRATYLADFLAEHGYQVLVLRAHADFYGNHVVNTDAKRKYAVSQLTIGNKFTRFVSQDRRWYFEYRKHIARTVKESAIGSLYICGNPFFYFTLGAYFKRQYNIPYILDFRDPWYQDLRLNKRKGTNLLNASRVLLASHLIRIKERKSVKDASYVVNVTQRRTKIFRQYYSFLDPSRFITVPNGYDDRKLNRISLRSCSSNTDKGFNIGIFGKFGYYDRDTVDLFVSACLKLSGTKALNIHHWGENEFYLRECAKRHNLAQIITFHGHVDYVFGLKAMSRMNCLVLNHRDNRSQGTKIFDYIYLNKPIIAFASKNSAISDLLEAFKNSFVVDTVEDFVNAVNCIYGNSLECLDDGIDIEKYSRRFAMAKLLKYIDQLYL